MISKKQIKKDYEEFKTKFIKKYGIDSYELGTLTTITTSYNDVEIFGYWLGKLKTLESILEI